MTPPEPTVAAQGPVPSDPAAPAPAPTRSSESGEPEVAASAERADDPGTSTARPVPDKRVVLVAAVAENGVIGRDGEVPWRIAEDMRHFRKVTTGHTVVMGRVTYDSIGRPLPNRENVVITRDPGWSAGGVTVVGSIDEALAVAADLPGDVMVIGGAQIYEATMAVADVQVITEVHQAPDGDTFYPAYDRAEWVETRREPHEGYDFVWLERR